MPELYLNLLFNLLSYLVSYIIYYCCILCPLYYIISSIPFIESKNFPDNLEKLSLAYTPVFRERPEKNNGIPKETHNDEIQ